MGWFSRRSDPDAGVTDDRGAPAPARYPAADETLIDENGMGPLRPRDRGLGEGERERIAAGLAALAEAGVDVDNLESLAAAYDQAYAQWSGTAKRRREDHDLLVERFAIGLGEYLTRHTDLRWRIVTDVFGTDLAVADEREGDFVVVPGNLVAARWMRGETGWLPGVVRHLISVRESAR